MHQPRTLRAAYGSAEWLIVMFYGPTELVLTLVSLEKRNATFSCRLRYLLLPSLCATRAGQSRVKTVRGPWLNAASATSPFCGVAA